MKKAINIEAQTVTFSRDDETVVGSIAYADLSHAMKIQSALHGVSQKIGDSYAGALKATEDLDMTPEDWSVAQVEDGIKRIKAGDWNLRTGGGGAAVTDLAVALAEATGFTVEEAVEVLKEKSKEEKEAVRKHPDVAAVLARIRRERAEKKEKELAAKAGTGQDLSELFGKA